MAITSLIFITLIAIIVYLLLKDKNSNNNNQNMQNNMASLSGQFSAMIKQQEELRKTLNDRLDAVNRQVSQGLLQNTEKTTETIKKLHERLGSIDMAQKNLLDLSTQVTDFKNILSNKKARGTFGEVQLEDLVSQILPPSAYKFQALMPNSKIVDCLLTLPNPPGSIPIDAKFPLESYYALNSAKTDADKVIASRQFKADFLKHVKDISEKYIIAGETATSALMFLPSEAVYAELYANFPEVVEKSYKAKVWIVSPTTLMATLNTVRAILKDSQMMEQAELIQKELSVLMEDIRRLDDRVSSLGTHFNQAQKDIEQITTSSKKVSTRANKIENMEIEKEPKKKVSSKPKTNSNLLFDE